MRCPECGADPPGGNTCLDHFHALLAAETDNAELREMARRLREDPAAIEEQARRELGLIKPGEVLFIVKDISKK